MTHDASQPGGPLNGGRRMTGSALQAVDVVLALLLGENLLEMGGGPGGGEQKIRPGGRGSDFFLCLEIAVLLACQLNFPILEGK